MFEHLQQNGDLTHFYFCYRWFLLDFKRGMYSNSNPFLKSSLFRLAEFFLFTSLLFLSLMSSYDVIGRTETARKTGLVLVMSSYDIICHIETAQKTGLVLVMLSYDVIGRTETARKTGLGLSNSPLQKRVIFRKDFWDCF